MTAFKAQGWAIIDREYGEPYVQIGGTEAEAWQIALGWPSPKEIAKAKQRGEQAVRVTIREDEA